MESKGSATVSISAWERFEIVLDLAKQIRNDGYHAAAIVTAQTACEVCTELVLTNTARGVDEDKAERIRDLVGWNCNLGREDVRDRYVDLTGDRIQDQQFWPDFKDHVKRRRKIVHEGKLATPQQAEKSIEAVEAVIRHLLQNRT